MTENNLLPPTSGWMKCQDPEPHGSHYVPGFGTIGFLCPGVKAALAFPPGVDGDMRRILNEDKHPPWVHDLARAVLATRDLVVPDHAHSWEERFRIAQDVLESTRHELANERATVERTEQRVEDASLVITNAVDPHAVWCCLREFNRGNVGHQCTCGVAQIAPTRALR